MSRAPQRSMVALLLIASLLAIGGSRAVRAQEIKDDKANDPPPPPAPLVVVHVSALERVLQRLQDNLHDIDRDDVGEAFSGFIEGNAGGLKGLDRSKPFGVALFLTQALPPQPVPVVYAPVSDFDDLIKTMELGPITVKRMTAEEAGVPADSREERYTMTIRGGGGGQREIVVRDGYVFLSRNDTFLEGDVASLAKLAPRLGAQYDAAVSLDLTTISPLIRDVFLGMLRNQAQAELQRRDDEPMSQYIIRKANGLSTLELIEHVLRDGRNLTLGIKMREDSTNTIVELSAEATPDSEFAKYLADLASHPSGYASLVTGREPMTFSGSWMMAPREQKVGREWISSLAHSMTDVLTPKVEPGAEGEAEAVPPAQKPGEFVPHAAVQPVLDSLNATVDAGHFDVCFQFRELDPGKFGMIGAMRVVGGETLAGGLRELLTALQTQKAPFDISQNVAEHAGVAFHRIRSHEQRDEERRVYGDDSGLYVGASSQTLWFAIGSSRVLTELNNAMDRVAASATEPPSRQAPIQFLMQTNPWLALSPEEDSDDAIRRHELSQEAFDNDNDGMKLEIRPTENGARMRVELEAGFARMLTLMIAERYDRSRL